MSRWQSRGRARTVHVRGTRLTLYVVSDLGGPAAVRFGDAVFVVDTGDETANLAEIGKLTNDGDFARR